MFDKLAGLREFDLSNNHYFGSVFTVHESEHNIIWFMLQRVESACLTVGSHGLFLNINKYSSFLKQISIDSVMQFEDTLCSHI